MFKDIETELLSIVSDDPINKIAHMPPVDIAKTMDLIYNIKVENIDRVYTEPFGDIQRTVVIYNSKAMDKKTITHDMCPINGKLHHITLLPSNLLNKDESNAIELTSAIGAYISIRCKLLLNKYANYNKDMGDDSFHLILLQSVPVITCAIIRKIYTGYNIPTLIYNGISSRSSVYKHMCSETGIKTILDLFDEGLGVTELLDNGFICSIPCDDERYPGIWCNKDNEQEEKED